MDNNSLISSLFDAIIIGGSPRQPLHENNTVVQKTANDTTSTSAVSIPTSNNSGTQYVAWQDDAGHQK